MEIRLSRAVVRSLRRRDAPSLAGHIGAASVARHMSQIPHPYSLQDGEDWIETVEHQSPERNFGIAIDDCVAGGIGFVMKDDPRTGASRFSAEFGYWLGEKFWGQGIMTEAVRATVDWAFDALDLVRIFAVVHARNPASARVLEKAGFEFEGRMASAYFKDGEFIDGLMFAKVKPR